MDVTDEPDHNGLNITNVEYGNLTVNVAYRFHPPADSGNPIGWLRYFENSYGEVTFRFIVTGSGAELVGQDTLINPRSGYIQSVPSQEYSASVDLVAYDSMGNSVIVSTWSFSARYADTSNPFNGPGGRDCVRGTRVDDVRYDHHYTCNCSGTGHSGPLCETRDALPQLLLPPLALVVPPGDGPESFLFAENGVLARDTFAFGETYRVAPLNTSFGGYIDGDANANLSLTYDLQWWHTSPAPRGFFLDSATGEMLWQIPHFFADYTAQLVAQHPDTTQAVVYNITLRFRSADTTHATNGPGERDCAGGSDQRVDAVEFDGAYTCNCPSDTTAPNCDVAAIAASSSSDSAQSSVIAYSVAGGLIALLFIVIVMARVHIYRARHRPVDIAAMQDEIRQSLGMTSSMSVAHDEVGLSVTFGKSLERALNAAGHGGAEVMAREVGIALLAELKKLSSSGVPQRLVDMLKQSGTHVTVESHSASALVVMKKPTHGKLKPGTMERFASSLQQLASARKIAVNGEHFVDEVSVAVPKRVPREIDRHSVLRLGALGEGFFGEVSCSCSRVGRRVGGWVGGHV